ncbi:Transposase [Bradyrhizobium shewense]|uniref:Transposase n=1 Tax=Bradyrhizobium shewense TaxID=1761772 RepID=A0A1C3VSW7_9BRAD|nr:hypothetical protein [Bradyrhizobium shewense]SCB30808.1 Transposase [Bradyrhizobium shewense]
MGRFVEGADRSQMTLLPECLEDRVSEDNAVRVIDVFVEALDLYRLNFEPVIAMEACRNIEVVWLIGRLAPDHKTIADFFRKDNGAAIRKVCAKFIALCRQMGLLQTPSIAIDGSSSRR